MASNFSRKKATTPNQPKKQLCIKLRGDKPKVPPNFEEDTWAKLKSAICAIFMKQPDSCDLEKLYQDLCDQMLMIRSIALYLDRKYVKQTTNVRSLWDMGLQLFHKHLSLSPDVEHKTVTGLLRMVETERSGESVDRTLLNHLLKMFTALGIYAETFEKPYLECTSGFYAAQGMKYMQQSDAPDYLKHVEALNSYIRKTGQGIVTDEEKDKDMVLSLLEFKASLDTIWEECFFKYEAFSYTIKDAFEYLINLRQNRPAELIAKFLDEKLCAGNKGTSEEELEVTFDKGKDVFEAFYKKDLAKRLLLGKSASIDTEKSMISKLKTECGSQFTNKLEGMFKIDAAIVRIMKTRKMLSHTLLITGLFKQLKFPIKLADLKKRIESLIDRDYLERDKTNPQLYKYLA